MALSQKSGDHAAVTSFVALAQEFCRLLETKTRLSKRSFVKQVLTATVALYSAGLRLPQVTPERDFNPAEEWFEKNKGLPIEEQIKRDPRIQERSRRKQLIRAKIIHSLGGELRYHKIFEPFQDQEPITTTVSDDLEDIYCDMKKGLLAIAASGQVSANVVWEWKFGLETHWGRHAVSAINALHTLFVGM